MEAVKYYPFQDVDDFRVVRCNNCNRIFPESELYYFEGEDDEYCPYCNDTNNMIDLPIYGITGELFEIQSAGARVIKGKAYTNLQDEPCYFNLLIDRKGNFYTQYDEGYSINGPYKFDELEIFNMWL